MTLPPGEQRIERRCGSRSVGMSVAVGLNHYLLLGALLFVCGVVCMASKRNAIGILMGV